MERGRRPPMAWARRRESVLRGVLDLLLLDNPEEKFGAAFLIGQ
jgi:hypothetical protein